jgi:pyruvate dehydrogenase E1 component beta subunit
MAYDAKGLLKSAIRDENPVLYLENRVLYTHKEEVPEGEWLVPIGSADIKRAGTDITIVASGYAVHKALAAAQRLAGRVDAEVLDPRTLDPLDLPAVLASVRKTGNLLVVQEAPVQCSFASEVIRLVAQEAFGDLEHAPLALGAADVPVPFSPVLEKAAIPQVEDIVAAVQRALGRSG